MTTFLNHNIKLQLKQNEYKLNPIEYKLSA